MSPLTADQLVALLTDEQRAAVEAAKSMTPLTLLMVVGKIKAEALAAATSPEDVTPEPVADDRTAPCQNCFLAVVERDGQWVHEETGDVFCRNRRATPNPPHQCGSRDGLSGCWHPSHGGDAWRARKVTP